MSDGGEPAFTVRLWADETTRINLERGPATALAKLFVSDLLDRIEGHLTRARRLGVAGRPRRLERLGVTLAGIMRSDGSTHHVTAQRSSSGHMWKTAPPGLGRDRFWKLAEAMEVGGWIESRRGHRWETGKALGGKKLMDGEATSLRPTAALWDLAEGYGVSPDTRKRDWRPPMTLAGPASYADDDKVLVLYRPDREKPPRAPMPDPVWSRVLSDLRTINDANAAACIRGAGHTVTLTRRFQQSPSFGGRFYAPYVNHEDTERARITMDGKAVVEVDVKASHLSILLGLIGVAQAPPDAYAAIPVPRDVVKDCVVQAFGKGSPPRQWSGGSKGQKSGWRIADVRKAVLAVYPDLGRLAAILPPGTLDDVPMPKRGVVAGQWIVNREAAIIERAMLALVGQGIPVLPVHDSLIVPRDAQQAAKKALTEAFKALAGITPTLAVKQAR